jgi:hypothetical protein
MKSMMRTLLLVCMTVLLAACPGSGGGSSSTATATPSATATLSLSVSGSGTVTSNPAGIDCGSTCSASFKSGTQITLTAAPASGYAFAGWGGACSGTATTCSLALNQAQSVSASFTQLPVYTLSVSVNGNGAVTSSPAGINCGSACSASFVAGTQVMLSATPGSGASFGGWGGACSGTVAACMVPMNQAQSVTASFEGGEVTLSSHLFAPGSFWYQPIPADAPLNPNSAAYAQNLASQVQTYYGNASINTTSYAAPVYYVQTSGTPYTTSSDPNATPLFQVSATVNVQPINCSSSGGTWVDPNLVAQWQNVPIPAGATPSQGTDSEFDVYDISTQTYWEFWATSQVNGQWQGCWGGRIQNAGQSDGIFPNPYGGSATGLPYEPGEITPVELAAGKIDHVMGISIVNAAAWNVFSWPANRSDGYNPNNLPDQIPEGIRMRLDPSVDVDALNLTPVGRTIAIAAQKYGFVVWDKAGSVSLRASNPASYLLAGKADPYPALYGGLAYWQVLQNFPWDKMQFLPMNYGQPAPNAASATGRRAFRHARASPTLRNHTAWLP